jgi:hypothetical protein
MKKISSIGSSLTKVSKANETTKFTKMTDYQNMRKERQEQICEHKESIFQSFSYSKRKDYSASKNRLEGAEEAEPFRFPFFPMRFERDTESS